MNSKCRLVVVTLALLVVILMAASPVAARALRIEYDYPVSSEGYSYCWPVNVGTTTHPDGNIHIRGLVLNCLEKDPVDPRMSGTSVVVVDQIMDANGNGTTMGRFTFTSDEGGVIVGTVEGKMVGFWPVSLHNAGHGQGLYEGLQTWQDSTPLWVHEVILDPHGN